MEGMIFCGTPALPACNASLARSKVGCTLALDQHLQDCSSCAQIAGHLYEGTWNRTLQLMHLSFVLTCDIQRC